MGVNDEVDDSEEAGECRDTTVRCTGTDTVLTLSAWLELAPVLSNAALGSDEIGAKLEAELTLDESAEMDTEKPLELAAEGVNADVETKRSAADDATGVEENDADVTCTGLSSICCLLLLLDTVWLTDCARGDGREDAQETVETAAVSGKADGSCSTGSAAEARCAIVVTAARGVATEPTLALELARVCTTPMLLLLMLSADRIVLGWRE